jgi:hypothetical protein
MEHTSYRTEENLRESGLRVSFMGKEQPPFPVALLPLGNGLQVNRRPTLLWVEVLPSSPPVDSMNSPILTYNAPSLLRRKAEDRTSL